MSSPFLTIPRARSMIWPSSQQTMGELLDQDKLSCKIREYIDGGNLPRNIDEAVAYRPKGLCLESAKSGFYRKEGARVPRQVV